MYTRPLVTLRKVDPIGIWVDSHPVVIPLLDAVLVEDDDLAYGLARTWHTWVQYLEFVRDYDYMVFLPKSVQLNVYYAAEELGWTV